MVGMRATTLGVTQCIEPSANSGGAKRAGAKAVKKMEQHSTEYKLSSEDAITFRALGESELLEPRQS